MHNYYIIHFKGSSFLLMVIALITKVNPHMMMAPIDLSHTVRNRSLARYVSATSLAQFVHRLEHNCYPTARGVFKTEMERHKSFWRAHKYVHAERKILSSVSRYPAYYLFTQILVYHRTVHIARFVLQHRKAAMVPKRTITIQRWEAWWSH